MVFNESSTTKQFHNRTNIRDTSTDRMNLHGDAHLNSVEETRNGGGGHPNAEFTPSHNHRRVARDSREAYNDADPPPLEEARTAS